MHFPIASVPTATAVLLGLLLAPMGLADTQSAQAAPRDSWTKCSKPAGNRAAERAGLDRGLDRALREVFDEPGLSRLYRSPTTSLCADYNDDGRLDRAVHYQCCTGSSPAPWVVLQGQSRGRWRIAYKRLTDTTFRLEGDGINLRTIEPKYSRRDANCCPSRLRIGTLRWTGTRFVRFFKLVDSETAASSLVATPADKPA